jgi:hypothetical protein
VQNNVDKALLQNISKYGFTEIAETDIKTSLLIFISS